MIVRTIEILLEYSAIILCIHKIGKKRIKLCMPLVCIYIINLVTLFMIDEKMVGTFGKLFVLGCILLYVRIKVTDSWKRAVGIYVTVLLIMMALQYLVYFIISVLQVQIQRMEFRGLIVNLFVLIVLLAWKESYLKKICKKIKELSRECIILIMTIICLRLLYLSNTNHVIKTETLLQFYIEIAGLFLVLILWISSEIENRHKAKELKMYELYNQAFEDTIATIRMRQHEFLNHINAIKCLQYTIKDKEELFYEQEQYCDNILRDSKISDLLKLKMEPVLIGFLYAKITTAKEAGIHVEYEIESIDIKGRIENYEIIELIGILYDNAVEALVSQKDKKMLLKLKVLKKGFVIQVANISSVYTQKEIEKLGTYGYSTKGENRGIGLFRMKEIIKKVDAVLLIQNIVYDGENYLCFEIRVS